jgi:hypothetical protein
VSETVAFTGARKVPLAGVDLITDVVGRLPATARVLHGGCLGVDALVGRAAWERGLGVHTVLPGLDQYTHPDWARYCHSHERLAGGSESYRARNTRLVALADRLIAFPAWPERDGRSVRSGTWMCVRIARAAGKPDTVYLLCDVAADSPLPEVG